jgi:hypothetical protein
MGRLMPADLRRFRYLFLPIEVADVEVSASKQGFKVGELKNPSPHGRTGGIEALLLQENRQENLLNDVLGLRSIPKYPERDRIDLPTIAVEQFFEAF